MNSAVNIALLIIAALVTFAIIISLVNRNKKNKEDKTLDAEFDHFTIKNNLAIDKSKKAQ